MLSVGEWVEVLSVPDVLSTLDQDGAIEQLPFMPEMLPYCGQRFCVLVRGERTCARGLPAGARPIRRLENAIVLEGLRCDGASHGGCQLGCMLYWKERWVRRVEGLAPREAAVGRGPMPVLRVHQRSDPTAYYCQGTQLARATKPEAPLWSPGQYLRMLRVRTLTLPQLVAMCSGSALGRVTRAVALRGRRRLPPRARDDEVLGLEPGEWVQVKSKAEIFETLDAQGRHRGLGFINDYEVYCGKSLRVKAQIDRIVDEVTGKIRRIQNTVALEGSYCLRHNGCARGMPAFWREAWLRRVDRPEV
jgi:hypothetical protein